MGAHPQELELRTTHMDKRANNWETQTVCPPAQCKEIAMNIAKSDTSETSTNDDVLKVADGYRAYAFIMWKSHSLCTPIFESKNKILGIPAAVISAVVGSSIFANIALDNRNIWLMLITGMLSIGAAILSALQTFLRYSEIAQAHKASSAGYEQIRRKIDLFKLRYKNGDISKSDLITQLEDISNQMNELGATSPTLPEHIQPKALPALKREIEILEDDKLELPAFLRRQS